MSTFLVVNNGERVLRLHLVDHQAQEPLSSRLLDPGTASVEQLEPGKTVLLIESLAPAAKALN